MKIAVLLCTLCLPHPLTCPASLALYEGIQAIASATASLPLPVGRQGRRQ